MSNINQPEFKSPISNERLVSIDVFRGMTIVGMILVINPGSWKYIYAQLRHANWHGCTFTDLIYPFFLFIVGVSIVFALSKAKDKTISMKALYYKIIKRTIILFVLGLFINSFPQFDLVNIRIMGVLQRIAVCYLIVSLLFLHTGLRGQIIWTVALLFVYWVLMEWIPIPDVGAGSYEKYTNLATYVDKIVLSGHMGYYEKLGEPEGVISSLPSLSSTLFGVLTGHLLRMKKADIQKTCMMLVSGIVFIILGLLWSRVLPINKHLWTSSYAVLTTGYALVVLAILYFVIDVKGYRKGFQPFLVFGTNAITVYVLSIVLARMLKFIEFTTADGVHFHLRSWLFERVFAPWLGDFNGSLVYAVLYVCLWYGIMLIFYKRKIFIKI